MKGRVGSAAFRCLLFSILCLLVVTGCSPKWRAKFIRKKKGAAAVSQPILVLQPDYKALLPAADRYREHFAYWKSWHTGLLDSLGQIRKRDIAQLNGVIGELQAMQALLAGPPADRLLEVLADLRELQDQLGAAPVTWQIPSATRSRLEQLYREIGKQYYYARVKDALVSEPEDAPE